MKYFYSILVILTAFLALPVIVDYSSAAVNGAILYVNTGSFKNVPEQRKGRDYDTETRQAAYTASTEKHR